MVLLTFPETYGYVVMASLTLALECTLVGFKAGGARKNTFSEEWMNKYFKAEHQEAFGKDSMPSKEGYPDTGSGRYAKKLTYKKWYEFNLVQRSHANFLEQVMQHCLFILVAGYSYPTFAAVMGVVGIIARFMFVVGYSSSPASRMMGFRGTMLSLMTLFVASLMTIWNIT